MNKQQEEALVAEFRQMTPGERDFFLQTARVVTRERKNNIRHLKLVSSNASFSLRTLGAAS